MSTPPPSRPPLRVVAPPPAEGEQGPTLDAYRRLAAVFHAVLSEQSLDSLLELVADTLAEIVPYEALHIYGADEVGRELVPQLVRSEWAERVLDQSIPFGVGITGWAVEHREAVLANSAHLDPRVAFVPGTPDEPEALIVVPLVARGVLKGTLNLYRIGAHAAFSEHEFELAQRCGDAAALALDNAHIRARLEHAAQTDSLTGLYDHRSFHEQLTQALADARPLEPVAVVMIDVDDFKRVNDVHGHDVGDDVLVELARHLTAGVRGTDVACRVGGEEFAVIASAVDEQGAVALAERLAQRLTKVKLDVVGHVALSVGVALGPLHASNPRELAACAEAAMMAAKSAGGDGVVLFGAGGPLTRPGDRRRGELRSVAHLKLLQSLATRLNRVDDVPELGATVARELRRLLDYDGCRVVLRDGERLEPIAFSGRLADGSRSALDLLETRVGEGIAGGVVATGNPVLIADASQLGPPPGAHPDEPESLLAAPLAHDGHTIGAIVVSKAGSGRFGPDDLRLLEVVAGHAALALENARQYETQRREAETAHTLLAFGRALAAVHDFDELLVHVVDGVAAATDSPHVSLWLQTPGGALAERAHAGGADTAPPSLPVEALAPLAGAPKPVVVTRGSVGPLGLLAGSVPVALAEIGGPGSHALLVAAAPRARGFDAAELDLFAGLAQNARLALAHATGVAVLARTLYETNEALASALAHGSAS